MPLESTSQHQTNLGLAPKLRNRNLGGGGLYVVGTAALVSSMIGLFGNSMPPDPPVTAANVTADLLATTAPTFVEINELDFGEAWAQPAFSWKLTVRNRGDDPLEILSVQSGCTCTWVESLTETIAPGESVPMNVSLDLRPDEEGPLPHEFTAGIVISGRTAEDDFAEAWTILGTVVPSPVHVDPHDLVLGEILRSDTGNLSREIVLTADHGERAHSVTIDPESAGTVEFVPAPDTNGAQRIRLRLHEPAAAGPLRAYAVLTYPHAHRDWMLRLPIQAEIVEEVEAVPATILVGLSPVGGSFEEYAVLRSRRSEQIEGFDVASAPDGLEVIPTNGTAHPRSEFGLAIRGRVLRAGSSRSQIELAVHVAGVPEPVPISVPILMHGRTEYPEAEAR